MWKYLREIWQSKSLRSKILFTFGIIALYRILVHIPIPGVDASALKDALSGNSLLGGYSLLTGGSMENFSIVMMGLSPYINASIIIQLLTVIVPSMEELSKEGERGRRTLNRWTRYLTLPIAVVQSYGILLLLNAQTSGTLLPDTSFNALLPIMLVVSVGTILLMWLGELIGERGIGNGTSVIIFAGIVGAIPGLVAPALSLVTNNADRLVPFVGIILVTLIFMLLVVLFTEGQRRIPVTYAGQRGTAQSQQSYLPIRVNQAGMIPIIFAFSFISFPGILAQFFTGSDSTALQGIGNWINLYLHPNSLLYLTIYFLLILGFTFFYVSITFNTEQVADVIQKRGGFIPGLRPGKETSEYLRRVSNHLNLFGGLMIGLIAAAPLLLQFVFSQTGTSSVPILISGSGLIILVGVILDVTRKINAELLTQNYDRFYKG